MSNINPEEPDNSIPLLFSQSHFDTQAIRKACKEARASLAQLAEVKKLLPDPFLLLKILPHLVDQMKGPLLKETSKYLPAICHGLNHLRTGELCKSTAEDICTIARGKKVNIRKTEEVVIGNKTKIYHTPPAGEDFIRSRFDNLMEFIHEKNRIDPLIRMAILEAQFLLIHPFTDGNGRTARVFSLLYLMETKLLEFPVLFLSEYIIPYKKEYGENIRLIRFHDEWEKWICFMLQGIEETANLALKRAKAIQ